jgi:CubicO group peptidase (beta-lactamase class C family)
MGYGYQWWTRQDGSFNALGIHGQHIHVDPARRMVVVVNSADFTAESLAARTALFNAIRAALDSELPNSATR